MGDLTLTGDKIAIRMERLRRGLSMDKAASLAGMSHVTWRRIERGQPVRALHLAAALRSLDLPAATASASDVLADAVSIAVRAGRMRVLVGFGGAA